MVVTDTLTFLNRVWTERQSWVDIPSKIRGHWIPYSIEWPDPELAAIRIQSCADDENVYFSPAQYKNRGRRYEDVLPTYWLWADLDRVTPEACAGAGFTPTLAWSSSPGRYQALWELDHPCSPEGIEKLNKQMTYTLGADKSGWDLTQVLRVPGTRNFKYPGGPVVEVVMSTDEIYNPRVLFRRLKKLRPLIQPPGSRLINPLVRADAVVPPQAEVLLRATPEMVVKGERSTQLWKLECLLAEAGFAEERIFDLVWPSAWNKWKEVNTGEGRLRREIQKAVGHVTERVGRPSPALSDSSSGNGEVRAVLEEEEEEKKPSSPFVTYGNFLSANLEAPRWLVSGIWTADSHGILGGEPKSLKSILSLALGMSVASGRPFLMDKKYPVPRSARGPVLIIQEENDPWRMQDLMRKIAGFYGLIKSWDVQRETADTSIATKHVSYLQFPREIPLKLLNNYGFDMLDPDHRELLEEEIKEEQPSLVILDPLYLMVGGADMNKSQDLALFFKWLIKLKFEYGTAILANHHFRKQQANTPTVRPGQRVLGSTTFHAWVASALYSENTTAEDDPKNVAKVRLEREFRNMGPLRTLDIRLMLGDPGDMQFSGSIVGYDAVGELIRLVEGDPGVTASQAAERLGIDKRTVLKRARGTEKLECVGGKQGRGHSWRLYLAD